MKYINRSGSYSLKFDDLKARYGREDLLPLWVADMDFKTPEPILNVLKGVLSQGVCGYNVVPSDYYPSIVDWLYAIQHWKVKSEWLSFIPGIVKGIGYVINFFTERGDKIIVQPPIYPPFINLPAGNGREVVYNPLIKTDLEYEMDLDGLSKIISGCKLLILSNPHNPAGILWSRDTLIRLADICYENNVLVISDEIHADMPLFGREHIPFASVSEKAAAISITFGAPSKTFNMAGIVSSYSVIPNNKIRDSFYKWMRVNELSNPTIFATLGTIAAYRSCNEWRLEMIKTIENNVKFVVDRCNRTGLINAVMPQASFLVWLDCSKLVNYLSTYNHSSICDRRQNMLVDFFVNDMHLALNDGSAFGQGGNGYMRLNAGTSLEVLNEAMNRIYRYLNII